MLQFAGADTKRESAEGTESAGVRVGTDDAETGQDDPLLRAYKMGDALVLVTDVEHPEPERGRPLPQRRYEVSASRHHRLIAPPGQRIHYVVDDAKGMFRPANRLPAARQRIERNAARALVHDHTVYVYQAVVAIGLDAMAVPQLVEKSRRHAGPIKYNDTSL